MSELTVITSLQPTILSKQYTLNNSKLDKSPGGKLSQGTVEVKQFDTLRDLANIITHLKPSQALTYGLPKDRDAREIASRARNLGAGTITRTEADFEYSNGSAVMMIDYDPDEGAKSLTPEELRERLIKVIPALEGVQMLWAPSSSSHICLVDGEDLTGLRGQHLYFMVENGTSIPNAGRILVERLWLEGEGYIKLSIAGQMLERTLFDRTVWQASRMDFAAGAATGTGLEQRRGIPILLNEQGNLTIDCSKAFLPLSDQEMTNLDKRKTDARYTASSEAAAVRNEWLNVQLKKPCMQTSDGSERPEGRNELERMLDIGELAPSLVIYVELESKSKQFEPVSVGDVCSEPDRYNFCRTLDPLEPDIISNEPVGMIVIRKTGAVELNSIDSGGQKWKLRGNIVTVPVKDGPIGITTKAILQEMRTHGSFFDYGDGSAVIQDGRILVLDEPALDYALSSRIHVTKEIKGENKAIDPPPRMLKHIISLKKTRGLRELIGISDSPIIYMDGTIITRPGYDETTGIYVLLADPAMGNIPMAPNHSDVIQAIDTIWQPFALFPYNDSASKGAILAAAITSVFIDNFPTAPAYVCDGPVRGAGKTLLIQAIATLGAGRKIGVTPLPRKGDEAEMQKVITSAVHPDHRARGLIFDNCSKTISSDALAALLTTETFTGRILGSTRLILDVPARIFVALTGTNIELDADLGRRFLSCRLDPNCEVAFIRQFDFDPVEMVLDKRTEIIAAMLILVRASLLANADAPAPFGSFSKWDNIVRRAVLHAVQLRPNLFADPVAATIERVQFNETAQDHDAFLRALKGCFEDQPFEAKDVAKKLREALVLIEGVAVDLADAFKVLGVRPDDLSTRSIGRHLGANRDRWSANLVLRCRKTGRSCIWRIEDSKAVTEVPNLQRVS